MTLATSVKIDYNYKRNEFVAVMNDDSHLPFGIGSIYSTNKIEEEIFCELSVHW